MEPAQDAGKVVWAELATDTSPAREAPDVDLDALLAAWPDDEPAEPQHTVRLGAVPTDLLLDAKRHIDNVVRELHFERAAEVHGPDLPPEFRLLIETVTESFARARTSIKEQAAAAAAAGDRQTELVLTLPVSSVTAGEQYLAALDEADRHSRSARLLTLETPPLHRLFRRWYVTALVEQLRSLSSGRQPVQPTPFLEVLAGEVASLTASRDDPDAAAGVASAQVDGQVRVGGRVRVGGHQELTPDQLLAHPEYRGLRDAPGHPPLPDCLAAPFISRDGGNIGLLQLSDKVDGTAFTAGDEAVCVQLSLMVSSALEHLEVGRELESALQRLRKEQEVVSALHDVGRAVISQLEHAEVVQVVTDAATAMTGAQFGAFSYDVLDDSGQSYALHTVSGVPREVFPRFPATRSTAVFGPTFDGDGVVRLDDVTLDARYGRSAPRLGVPEGQLPVRSYLAVPVRLSCGEVVGGLFFGHEREAVFDDSAERLAGYAGIALENGRLYDAARRESRAKETIAAALEKPLRPPVLPDIPGARVGSLFQPFSGAGGLAGDFYDAFRLPDGRWLLALGDVSGKGPEAAAVAGLVRHTLWAAAQLSPDPVAVLDVVNTALVREDTERFATLVVAVVDQSEDALRVDAVWAGHPAGLLITDGGVERVSGDGMPVGMFAQAELSPVRFTMHPDQTLVLFTDGLAERDAAVLQDAELMALFQRHGRLPVDEMLHAVAADIDSRHGRRDDVAAIALRLPSTTRRPGDLAAPEVGIVSRSSVELRGPARTADRT